jgi:tripartite-type tricarboxylate transporter receptor subunit TctC
MNTYCTHRGEGGNLEIMTKRRYLAAALALALAPCAAGAESVADFYKGHPIKIIVGGTAEGGYAPYARMLQLHMGRHLPGNPSMLVQYMPGAGGLVAANFVYNAAPKDGTVVGAVQRSIVRLALLGDKGVRYEPAKINWIGSLYNDVSVCVAWRGSGVERIEDVMRRELIIGGTGLNDTEQFPAVLNNVLGTKFRIISGYSGSGGINLALERGEIAGRCGWSWDSLKSQKGEWLRDKKLAILVQIGPKRLPEIGDVPLVTELARTGEQRAILHFIFGEQILGKPFMMAPDVPPERVAAIRAAFIATAEDPVAVAEMKKLEFDVSPLSGADMQKIVDKTVQTPRDVIEKARAALVYKDR